MMKGWISEQTIQQVMERVDMPALIGEYTRLERRGAYICISFYMFVVDLGKK